MFNFCGLLVGIALNQFSSHYTNKTKTLEKGKSKHWIRINRLSSIDHLFQVKSGLDEAKQLITAFLCVYTRSVWPSKHLRVINIPSSPTSLHPVNKLKLNFSSVAVFSCSYGENVKWQNCSNETDLLIICLLIVTTIDTYCNSQLI